MAIASGARIGVYEVVSLIGSGGMGEVYLARDTQLGREVALKVLPEVFAADPERLARFRREAQVLAALKHPNIAIIHGLEEDVADGVHHTRALVLEYVEGQTLAERIGAGPIPLDEALPIARQIGEALQSAHDQGVIHRDLKPSNIKFNFDGTVKVLDFGLAKLGSRIESSGAGSAAAMSLSPTITTPAATMMGVILGTAAYMAPEQAKGKPADKRSDVWAFGCVLFEMLTGRRAFEGDDVSETLASVIKGEPDWSAVPSNVPKPIQTLLRSCLIKDSRARLADIAGALFVLKHLDMLATQDTPAVVSQVQRPRSTRPYLLAGVIGLAAVAATAWLGWTLRPADPRASAVTRFGISLPDGEAFTNAGRHLVAVSPDGSRFVYSAANRLNLRRLDQLTAAPIRGTEGAGPASPRQPFFSPDGEWVGYWSAGQLKKISVNGGAPVALCEAQNPEGASWGEDNAIVYADTTGIRRVSADGGVPELLVKSENGRKFHYPQLLPGGRTILYTALPADRSGWDQADIVVRTLNDGSAGAERRVAVGTDGRYLRSGHLVYVVRGSLMAMPFDASTFATRGGPVPVLENVAQPLSATVSGAAHLGVSATGTLVYVTSLGNIGVSRTAVWVDRQGHEEPLGSETRPYLYPRLSPDGTRVAFDVTGDNRDIWIWNLAQRAMTRLTTDPTPDRVPVWVDDRRIVFSSDRKANVPNLYWQPADGTLDAERLTESEDAQFANSVTTDGKVIFRRANRVAVQGTLTEVDLMAVMLSGKHEVAPVIQTTAAEFNGEVSPDNKWIAYQTDATGRYEIVVRPYPDLKAGQWPVSTAGGTEPLWSRSGRELFYRSPSGDIMRVDVKAGQTWASGAPERLVDGDGIHLGPDGSPFRTYDVSLDGRRFLVLKNAPTQQTTTVAPRLIVVQNWFTELQQRVPVK